MAKGATLTVAPASILMVALTPAAWLPIAVVWSPPAVPQVITSPSEGVATVPAPLVTVQFASAGCALFNMSRAGAMSIVLVLMAFLNSGFFMCCYARNHLGGVAIAAFYHMNPSLERAVGGICSLVLGGVWSDGRLRINGRIIGSGGKI